MEASDRSKMISALWESYGYMVICREILDCSEEIPHEEVCELFKKLNHLVLRTLELRSKLISSEPGDKDDCDEDNDDEGDE